VRAGLNGDDMLMTSRLVELRLDHPWFVYLFASEMARATRSSRITRGGHAEVRDHSSGWLPVGV
jgi:hypothetical protein